MAARDRYKMNLECPSCSNKGEISLSENDYPFMTSCDLEVDDISGTFSADVEANRKLKVTCLKCGKPAKV
ncbi:MAG: hypothetical protein IPK68_11265 [Bdellovibrionales bacterium]|nr:hypothetical protein [Bdellovibrionales bacterium]